VLRLSAIFLVTALLFASLSCSAQGPVPLNSYTQMAALHPSLADARAMQAAQSSSPAQPVRHRHWTKGGKIMTIIGVPVMAAGGALTGATMSRHCNHNDISCFSDAFVLTGDIVLTASGVALTVVGVTRRSTE